MHRSVNHLTDTFTTQQTVQQGPAGVTRRASDIDGVSLDKMFNVIGCVCE